MRRILPLLLTPLLAFASGALSAQQAGLKIDEPGFQIALSAQTAGNTPGCPAGFYALRISDGSDPGVVPGAFSSELLLLDPGSRVLAGGLNFGGLADSLAPGFAAVTIANAANENQQLRVSLSGSRPGSAAGVRVRVALRSRAPSPLLTVYTEDVTVTPTATLVRSEVVAPGFYELVVTPLDPIPGADASLQIGLESSFVTRPGGGFQGGVNFGGFHDPARAAVSGFAAFCLADPHTVAVRTVGRTTNPAFGAGDLRVQLLRDNSSAASALVYDSQFTTPITNVEATVRITNELSTPLIATTLNGVVLGSVPALQTVDLAYSGPARGNLRIAIARGEGLAVSQGFYYTGEILFTANGETVPVHIRHNNLYREVFSFAQITLAPVMLYSPQIDNGYGAAVEVRIFDGVENAEYSQVILGGLVTIVNRNLGILPPPRVYFPIQPGQSARVRAITQNGQVATIFLQAYSDLAQAASGNVIAVITPTTFGSPNPVCETPTVVVPGCVSASTVFSQTLAVTAPGQLDTIRFTLCPNYDAAMPNTLRVIRPIVFCSEPSPAPCASNSGLTVSSVNALSQPVFGPFSIPGNSALSVVMSGTQGVAGETYCLSLRQAAPWEGIFSYEFRLAGGSAPGL
jgi:hypothetical protein